MLVGVTAKHKKRVAKESTDKGIYKTAEENFLTNYVIASYFAFKFKFIQ